MPFEVNTGGQGGGGGTPSTSNIDVVGTVGDRPTPLGGSVSKSVVVVNPTGSPT